MTTGLDLTPSPRAQELRERLVEFMNTEVFPAEAEYHAFRAERGPQDHTLPPVVERLKEKARERGLWNLFLPAVSGISNLDYAAFAEITGWSLELAPEAINGQAPDTGNIELLHLFGTGEQKRQWLDPSMDGTVRSVFAMTENDVASSDATNIESSIVRDRDEYIINGRKWWSSGAADERARLFIVMGKTDPDAPRHRQQSMVLVPRDTPGLTIVRDVPVFGRHDQHGHCEVLFTDVSAPATHLLGAAERAMQLMVTRAHSRVAFGKPLAEQGMVQRDIAESWIAITQARLLCQHAAAVIDAHGNKADASLVSQAKVSVPRVALDVIDRAIQVHGGAGVGDDVPLTALYGWHRAMRIFDGPDEVHLRSIARMESVGDALLQPRR